MALKIRLRRQGRANNPSYRLVVTEIHNKRDGKYVEALGWYHPTEKKEENVLLLKSDRIRHWMENGAELTEKAKALVKQVAPDIVKQNTERERAKQVKLAAKRRERRRKAAAKAS